MKNIRYQWFRAGDLNAFFGLMLDNIAGMILMVSMLSLNFEFPVDFALKYMIPGTAIGVLVGDVLFFWLAFRLAKKENRTDVCAMPLGLDTPSTLGMVFFVVGPAYASQLASGAEVFDAATHAWHVGMVGILITGLIKLVCALGSGWIRNAFPRAGLLGSLAAIALVLIAFMPLTELAANPVVGFGSLVIVLVTLIARNKLPLKIPGALGAVLIGTALWYGLVGLDNAGFDFVADRPPGFDPVWFPLEWLSAFSFGWVDAIGDSVNYLPYIIPFAVATVIGGIDCAESATSAGDDYHTGTVIGIEGVATLVAGLCGGVIQTTPYIGHPAYKAMGGRAAYTLATALFVGSAGLIGYFSLIFNWLPKEAVFPILIFIGLEITAQSFHVTPRRHYAAIAIACMPALAKLATILLGQFMPHIDFASLDPGDAGHLQQVWMNLSVLAGGFIITSLIWASALAKIIDRRFYSASTFFAFGGIFVLFGIMHTPLAGEKMFWPWQLNNNFADWASVQATKFMGDQEVVFATLADGEKSIVIQFALAYLVMSLLLFLLGTFNGKAAPIDSDEDFDKLMEH